MAINGILRENALGTFFDETLLRNIREKNNLEVVATLHAEHVDPCQLSMGYGTTLLHMAAQYGNNTLAEYLINAGANVEVQNKLNETPLMFAIDANQEDTIKLLLKFNADIFIPNSRGECVLSKALKGKQNISKEIVTALLSKVTVEALNNSEHVKTKKFHLDCPLYHFIPLRNADVTRILLNNGSPVDAQMPYTNETSLHLAAKQLDLENIALLLEFNADVNAKRVDRELDEQTPLSCLPIEDQEDQSIVLTIVNLMINVGATVVGHESLDIIPAKKMLLHGNRDVVHAVLHYPVNLEFFDKDGMTLLHYLAINTHQNVFEELQNYEFDVNIPCLTKNRTMLHYAAMVANESSLKFLLGRRAEVNVLDLSCCTPLCSALGPPDERYNYTATYNNWNCIELLLKHGADPQIFMEDNFYWASNFHGTLTDESINLIDPIFAQLAINVAAGQPLSKAMENVLECFEQLKSNFDSHVLQLEELKPTTVDGSVTLYDLLIVSDEKISMFARNRRFFPDPLRIMNKSNLNRYYKRRLESRLLEFTQLVQLREQATAVLQKILEESYNIHATNVAENIISFVPDQDLYKMVQT